MSQPSGEDLAHNQRSAFRYHWIQRLLLRITLVFVVVTAFFYLLGNALSPIDLLASKLKINTGSYNHYRLHEWATSRWNKQAIWVGRFLFEKPVEARMSGSGDKAIDYCTLVLTTTLAIGLGSLWSLVDLRFEYDEWLTRLLLLFLRYYVGLYLLLYGSFKVIKTQFPFPDLERWLQPLGEISPMRLQWAYMGYSPAFNVFSGGGEMLAGLLLCFRATQTLGALISIAVMAQVVAINFCFDVPVKLFSTQLLVFSIIIAWFDRKRLINLFLLNRPTDRVAFKPIITWVPGLILMWSYKLVILAVTIGTLIIGQIESYYSFGDGRTRHELYGIYDVKTFQYDGKEIPLLVSDQLAWSQIVFDRIRVPAANAQQSFLPQPLQGTMFSRTCSGNMVPRQISIDQSNKRITSSNNNSLAGTALALLAAETSLNYKLTESGELELSGRLDQKKVLIKAVRRDLNQFLLRSRSFNWVQEYPSNTWRWSQTPIPTPTVPATSSGKSDSQVKTNANPKAESASPQVDSAVRKTDSSSAKAGSAASKESATQATQKTD